MMRVVKPYAAMKLSDVDWLGYIPAHWELKRLKYVIREIEGRSRDGQEQLLRVSQYTGVTERRDPDGADGINTRAESLTGYKRVEKNDLVVNIMLAWNGSMGVSRYQGIASPAYCVYRFRAGYQPWYFHHLLRSPVYKTRIKSVSTGVVESRLRLYTDVLYRVEALVPPPEEQTAIVRYLDWACGRLDRAIRAKRKIIALLNEQKQAIIHRAVTRGLDCSLALQPSGHDWLGDIPSDWRLRRAKYLFVEVDERSQSGSEELLSVSHLTGVTPRSQKNITMFKAESYAGHKLSRPGDLVINTMWAWMGALGVSAQFGIVSPSYGVYRQRRSGILDPAYIDLLLRTRTYVDEFTRRSTGIRSSRLRLYPEEFFKVDILIPPLPEQKEIAAFVAVRTERLNKAIEKVNDEVALISEYRTRLIADVVTGKLDVREAAANLPAEEPLGAAAADDDEVDGMNEDIGEEQPEPVA